MTDEQKCAQHLYSCWFKYILFRRKGLGVAHKAAMTSPELCTKEHTHFVLQINLLPACPLLEER